MTSDGVPLIEVEIRGRKWRAIIDTGFNGDLELPDAIRADIKSEFVGRITSQLAANQQIEEDLFLVDFPFDGELKPADATFTDCSEILMGTGLLRAYRLQIDFPAGLLTLTRV